MGYSWLGERMAEEHRRDLSILSGAADQASGDPAAASYHVLLPGSGSGRIPLEPLRSGTPSGSTWVPC
jgi:hypothetical protein